jgi:hypothetical protein
MTPSNFSGGRPNLSHSERLNAGIALRPAPCAVEPEPGVAVTHEYIGLLGLAKPLGGDVVAHIGKTSPRAACHVFLPCRAAGSK